MPNTPNAPLAQFSGTNPVTGVSMNGQGVALGSVDPNQLASGQLASYLRGNNPIVQDAAQQGAALAAARGGGMNSSIYSEASSRGAIDALRPVAESDAARYGAVQDLNLNSINQNQLERMGNNTSLSIAGINAAVQRAGLREQARQFDATQANRGEDREWQLADQRTAARANQRSTVFNQLVNTIFSDPSYWRDPEAAMGFFNQYSGGLDDLLANLFPEYNQQPGDAGGAAPPPQNYSGTRPGAPPLPGGGR